MRAVFLVGAALVMASCSPTLIGSNGRTVHLGNAHWANAGEAYTMAEAECHKGGLHARMSYQNDWTYQQYWDCIP